MKFFIPQAKKSEFETKYQTIIEILKDQFRWPIVERKIFSLDYVHDKKSLSVEVGQELKQRYEVMAILESSSYLVFTRTPSGAAGVTLLVNKAEVESVVDFD